MNPALTALTFIFSAIVPRGFRRGAIFVPILGEIRGKIGANVFSHNRGGDYIRRFVAPVNPNSTRQQFMRSTLGILATLWSTTLTQLQRDAWSAWAATQTRIGPLGNNISLTGINAYVWTNSHILDAGDTRIDLPPVTVSPNALLTMVPTISADTTADLVFSDTPLGANERPVMFMSLPQSGSAQPNQKQSRIVGYGALAQASPWAATLPFSVQIGQSVVFWGAVYDSATGLISAFLRSYQTRV